MKQFGHTPMKLLKAQNLVSSDVYSVLSGVIIESEADMAIYGQS